MMDRDFIIGNVAVRDIIADRRESGSKPGRRDDNHKVALVIEGGGMRGAYTAGMVDALAGHGLNYCFDAIYGTSAGGFAAVVFGAGQAEGSSWLYPEKLSGRKFIDFTRLLHHVGPAVSLRYLVDQILTVARPLDFAGLGYSATPIRLIATAADTMRPHALGNFVTAEDWKAALCATACIPFLAGPPVLLHGRAWVDGSLGEPLAVERAFADGATHVLALLSRAPSEARPLPLGSARLSAMFAAAAHPAWGRSLRMRVGWQGSLLLVRSRFDRAIGARPLLALRPRVACNVHSLTTDASRLRRAVVAGAGSVQTAFRG